jgi:hypothetical protein
MHDRLALAMNQLYNDAKITQHVKEMFSPSDEKISVPFMVALKEAGVEIEGLPLHYLLKLYPEIWLIAKDSIIPSMSIFSDQDIFNDFSHSEKNEKDFKAIQNILDLYKEYAEKD